MEKLNNYKSYKNADYIYSLSNKELTDYYNCYGHHHFSRKFCKQSHNIAPKSCNDCPCNCEHGRKHDHFCTGLSLNESSTSTGNSTFYSPSINVCENYPPSFTLKEDQLTSINKDINLIRKSKALMKKNLKELDELLSDTAPPKIYDKYAHLNEVERFYRSDKFIGSSMNIKSLEHNLPRNDIRPVKYITELKELELSEMNRDQLELINGNSLYGFRSKDVFMDSDLKRAHAKLQYPAASDPDFKTRPKTKLIYQMEV